MKVSYINLTLDKEFIIDKEDSDNRINRDIEIEKDSNNTYKITPIGKIAERKDLKI